MTDDDETTARELIENAFHDAGKNAPTINSALALMELIAAKLRNEPDFMEPLLDEKTALVEIKINELGTNPANPEAQLGAVGICVLAVVPNPSPLDLLAHLHNDNQELLALAHYTQLPDGDAALLIIVASPRGDLIAVIAETNGERNVHAFHIDDDDMKENHAGAMATTYEALAAAAKRRTL